MQVAEDKSNSVKRIIVSALSMFKVKQKQVEPTSLTKQSELIRKGFVVLKDDRVIANQKDESSQPVSSNWENYYKSKIWIKDGELQFGEFQDSYPVIVPNDGIEMFVNGIQTKNPSIIRSTDDIQFELNEYVVPTKWKIKVTSDKTKATIYVKPGTVRRRMLKDHKPTTRLELQWTEEKYVKNTVTIDEIYAELRAIGVVEGIDAIEIQKAILSNESKSFTIASAIPAHHGKDGYVKFLKNYKQINKPQENKDGSVNYKEKHAFPKISTGEVLAELYHPTVGTPGRDICGNIIPQKQGKPIQLKLGRAVQLVNEEKIISLENGRPKIEARGRFIRIDIQPLLVLRKDIDIETGNIRFNGNIEVHGAIQDTMEVEGNGTILIHDSVNNAKVFSSESVTVVNNVISSTIRSGEENLMLLGMESGLTMIKDKLYLIHSAMEQLMGQAHLTYVNRPNELSSLLHLLINQKFPKFPTTVKEFCQKVSKHEKIMDPSWKQLAAKLNRIFVLRRPNEIQDIDDIKQLLKMISISSEWLTITPEPKNNIQIPYAINSTLYCDGDIEVVGQGCYNTRMVAGSQVIIQGFAKNGDIYARDKIVIDEVGNEYGIETSLRVSATGEIKIGYVHEGTKVQVGPRSYLFKQPMTNVHIKLNKKQMMVFN